MITLPEALPLVLSQVHSPRLFYAGGTLDMHALRLDVDGVGQIALPLLPAQAEQLIAIAVPASCSSETETPADTETRRPWQIDAERVRIVGRRWEEDLAQVVRQATAALGIADQVRADLFKLLVYDQGSVFLPNCDSGGTPGMLATLVVMLPSPYADGELVIRHKGQEARLDLSRDEPSELAYAAFYADCLHEVLPFASGYRLALVYNLVLPGGSAIPRPPDRYSVHVVAT